MIATSYDANEYVGKSEKREINWQVRKECSRQREREIETETERHNEKTEMSKTKGVTRMIERWVGGWRDIYALLSSIV